jgi:hypothetical protein
MFLENKESGYPSRSLSDAFNFYFFCVLQICFMHCQPFQGNLILLSIQVTLAGRSIWLIPSLLLVIFSFAGISSKATHKFFAKLYATLLKRCKFFEIHRYQRAKPVIIDPGFYSLHKSDVFWVSEQRSVPSAYRLFTGVDFSFWCLYFD